MAITDTSIYQDKIMGGVEGDPNPFGYQNQINDFVIDNEEFEEVPGYNFIDAPSSLGSRLKNLQYFNNPRTGFIDNTILSKGNPDNSLINRTTNAFGNFRDLIGGGITNVLDNTILGRIVGGFDATNPRAFNYNPALQGQIDFMRSPDAAKLGISYGTNPNTGLNQIRDGALKGKNLQSMFGSNDLMAMYDKELARAQGVLENLPNQWSKLAASTDEADIARWKEKQLFHRNKVARIKEEQAAAAAAAQAAADERIAVERARSQTAPQRREGRGGDHMSRSVDQGGLGLTTEEAQAVSDANRNAEMSGWGLAEGGRVGLRYGGLLSIL
jgi:hypothetical protein